MITVSCAGRAYVTMIFADSSYTDERLIPVGGLQGIYATKDTALRLIAAAREAAFAPDPGVTWG